MTTCRSTPDFIRQNLVGGADPAQARALGLTAETTDSRTCTTRTRATSSCTPRGLPTPATGARAGYILQRLANASKPFATTMEIKGETAIVVVSR